MKTLIPALALSALLLVGCGSDDGTAVQAPSGGSAPGGDSISETTTEATSEPTAEPTEEPTDEPTDGNGAEATINDLLPMDDPDQSGNDETVTFEDQTSVTADVRDIEIITIDGTTSTGTLPEEAESGVWKQSVDFAQAGTGYLVEQSGGEFSDLSVVFARGSEVVIATEPEDVPFGYEGNEVDGILAQTWTTEDGAGGLFTRTRVGEGESLSEDTYRVYSWEAVVESDADGGGISLVPSDLGIFCFDDDAGTYESC